MPVGIYMRNMVELMNSEDADIKRLYKLAAVHDNFKN